MKYFRDYYNEIWKHENGKWYQWVKPGHIVFKAGWFDGKCGPVFEINEITEAEVFLELL